MQTTPIGWTDFSANLLKYHNAEGKTVWACVHASEGCRFCYSEALAKRWGRGEAFTAENMKALTPYFDADEASQILKSKKIAGKKVFIDDMSDLFGEWVSDEIIAQHFAVFALRRDVTFQVLTKRASRMLAEVSASDFEQRVELYADEMLLATAGRGTFVGEWPLPNVHLGVSIEDQKNADERLPLLLETPAAVRWASIEPLLNSVHLCGLGLCCPFRENQLDGIVIGGESGAGHREMPLETALDLVRDAREEGVAVYFKQDSGPRPGMQGRVPDGVWAMKEWPSTKGGFPSQDVENNGQASLLES